MTTSETRIDIRIIKENGFVDFNITPIDGMSEGKRVPCEEYEYIKSCLPDPSTIDLVMIRNFIHEIIIKKQHGK